MTTPGEELVVVLDDDGLAIGTAPRGALRLLAPTVSLVVASARGA